jgi:hypothetical protein
MDVSDQLHSLATSFPEKGMLVLSVFSEEPESNVIISRNSCVIKGTNSLTKPCFPVSQGWWESALRIHQSA